jgi:hypothetical protein
MSRPAPIHICFYSNRCEWSKAFIEEIAKTSHHKDFRFICADPSPNRPQLPSWLKQTPTLVISGEPEPRTNSEVMNWLYENKLRDGTGTSGSGNGAAGAVGGFNATGQVDPEPYLDVEMGGGFGDQYSFLGADTSTQGNGGLSMKHNFTYLGANEAVGTKEASSFQTTSNPSGGKRSKKEELFDLQLEQMMKGRDSYLPKSRQ